MSGIEAVVFDVGNVLFHWNPRHLYERLIEDRDRLDWFLANVVTLDWHFQLDAGRSFAECAEELTALFPDERPLIEAWLHRFNETLEHPVSGMAELVEQLHARQVPLYAITNFSADLWPLFRNTQPVFDRFRDIVVSGVERMVKPDAAIYHLAARRFGIAPGTALFIDDREDNVAGAIAAGFHGHHFVDAARLHADLTARGVIG
ncbi:hydrolase [Tardibacter chloracetimidivorans]|uniref:Hydrolase n=1 Tax=Tardibacter chloracetimidivorans TaxID=1921510 RepID=A0A1L3ZYZ6_9SPHN|nr:HAD family phosphatase [Tardibacter chloracetimidivorans]API60819.1 hydrolase [Tardibacter chloracetimidivorans]